MGQGFFSTLKSDSKEAAYRVAGVQVIKATKHSLLTVLRNKNVSNDKLDALSDFLDTEIGTAILSTMVGFMLSTFPAFKKDKRAQTIAKEFRVGGMALGANLFTDKVMGEILPRLESILGNLPVSNALKKPQKLRVESISEEPVYEQLEEEEQSKPAKHIFDVWH